MKKRFGLILLVLIMATVFYTGCSKNDGGKTPPANVENNNEKPSDGKVYEMKISHLTTEIDPLHVGYVRLKEMLNERTNGRINLTIYGNKQLASSDREQAEMVQNNLAQMATAPAYTVAALNSDLQEYFIYDYPFLMQNSEELYKLSDSDLIKEVNDECYEKTGIKAYPGFHIGWVKIASNAKPINSPEDLKGLKIRTTSSEMYMELVKAYGASPTPVAYGELFTALQQKTVDGMMTAASLYVSDRFYEVQKYMGAIDPFTIFHIPLINGEWYNSLPDDLKPIFDECMTDYIDIMRELEDEKEMNVKKELREKGMEVTEYNADQKQAFVKLGLEVSDKMADVAGKEFFERVKSFLEK